MVGIDPMIVLLLVLAGGAFLLLVVSRRRKPSAVRDAAPADRGDPSAGKQPSGRALECPRCLVRDGAFTITHSIALPPGLREGADDLSLQIVACGSCGFRGAAVYEARQGTSPESDSWSHFGFNAPEEKLDELATMIGTCPAQDDPRCGCSAHVVIETRIQGKWAPPVPIPRDLRSTFPMRVATGVVRREDVEVLADEQH